jgi:hypothetical protein
MARSSRLWLSLHLGLGLAWIALLASRASTASGVGATGLQVFVMLVVAGWLPSWALAAWQVMHRCWRSLLFSDLLWAGVLVLMAISLFQPLFFFNVAWFVPLALIAAGRDERAVDSASAFRSNHAMTYGTSCRQRKLIFQKEPDPSGSYAR